MKKLMPASTSAMVTRLPNSPQARNSGGSSTRAASGAARRNSMLARKLTPAIAALASIAARVCSNGNLLISRSRLATVRRSAGLLTERKRSSISSPNCWSSDSPWGGKDSGTNLSGGPFIRSYGNFTNPAWTKCLSKVSASTIPSFFISTNETQSVSEYVLSLYFWK